MVILDTLRAWDQMISTRLVTLVGRARLLRALASVVTHSGDSVLWLGMAAAAILWGGDTWRELGSRMLAGTLATGLATGVLKWVFRRQRPSGARLQFYTSLDRHAFPSGHAGRAACLVALLGPLMPPWARGALSLWALLVGLSRVALALHLASDVVGGWVTGLAVAGLLLLLRMHGTA